jgi:carbamoyltransferase
MIVLGVSGGLSHDPAAAIVVDGKLVASAEEERFLRKKQAEGEYPINAMAYCLSDARVKLEDVDLIATGWDAGLAPESGYIAGYNAALAGHEFFEGQKLPSIQPVAHHVAHAYAACIGSGFDEASVLVVDGQGEVAATTLYHFTHGELRELGRVGIEDSLGHMYEAVTRFLGFRFGSEGKTMGLAAYGTPTVKFPLTMTADGYEVGLPRPIGAYDRRSSDVVHGWMDWLAHELPTTPAREFVFDHPHARAKIRSPQIMQYADIAASAQSELQATLTHLAELTVNRTGSPNLVVGGGCGLNCSANGRLSLLPCVSDFYAFPASGDGGTAAGAALWAARSAGETVQGPIGHAYFGPGYSSEEIKRAIDTAGVRASHAPHIAERTAEAIGSGKVIGWFQGRAELGPRALGHRSIVADPTRKEMLETVNRIKGREMWRPLAPSMTADTASYLLEGKGSPFMLTAATIPVELRDTVPAVSHVDGTTRAQIVAPETHPRYVELIKHLEAASGIGVVLNTSFNDESEPIVLTPRDAIRTFYSSGLDCLAIGDWWLEK